MDVGAAQRILPVTLKGSSGGARSGDRLGVGDFGRHLMAAATTTTMGQGKSPDEVQTERVTAEAERWVSQTFLGTLLKQMRNSPFKTDLMSGGRGEEAFSPLYDQHLADRMARGVARPLVRSIVRQIRGGPARASASLMTEGGGDVARVR